MENYNISVVLIIEILGAIVTFFAAYAAVHKWIIQPYKNRNDKIDENERRIDELEKVNAEIVAMQKLQLKSQLAAIDHELTGNGVDNLKNIKKEIQNFLVDKV
jgi:hypothetical protein